MMKLTAGKLWGMRRMADANGLYKMTAVDQRPPIVNPIKEKRGVPVAPWEDVAGFKELLIEVLGPHASAMLLDPNYAYPRGVMSLSPAKGLILTLEDSRFTEDAGGRRSSEIDGWSVAKIKRAGGDAVKVLAWYRPDADPAVCAHQKAFVATIGNACRRYDLPFVFELLVYPLARDDEAGGDYIEMQTKRPQMVVDSVREFAKPEYAVDLFKLESPIAAAAVPGVGGDNWEKAQVWFDALDEAAGRPWVMLSAGAGMEEFRRILTHAYRAGASGYLAGRAIWADAFKLFPDFSGIRAALGDAAVAYMADINRLTDAEALPWAQHDAYGPSGPRVEPPDEGFRHAYADFEDQQ